ncbi:hypothetical protein CLOP_g21110 [Closterium sp. NIES-67]|nr:hypothetical protein CLOP_g21110 [Closterium sp. NIES-67]
MSRALLLLIALSALLAAAGVAATKPSGSGGIALRGGSGGGGGKSAGVASTTRGSANVTSAAGGGKGNATAGVKRGGKVGVLCGECSKGGSSGGGASRGGGGGGGRDDHHGSGGSHGGSHDDESHGDGSYHGRGRDEEQEDEEDSEEEEQRGGSHRGGGDWDSADEESEDDSDSAEADDDESGHGHGGGRGGGHGRGGRGGRGGGHSHDEEEEDESEEVEDDGEDEDEDEGGRSHGGHGERGGGRGGGGGCGGLCDRGGCSASSGVVDYWKLPKFQDCSSSGSSSSAPRKGNEGWCARGAVNVKECCSKCRSTNATSDGKPFNCRHWVHIPSASSRHGSSSSSSSSSRQCGKCILLPAIDALTPVKATRERCGSTNHTKVRVGKRCPYGENDPHFLGAHGTRFDFNGLPDRSFCLYTDRHVHLNMAMRGYLDSRPLPAAAATAAAAGSVAAAAGSAVPAAGSATPAAATSASAASSANVLAAARFVNGSAVRTWIRQLAIMWHDGEGSSSSTNASTSSHSLVLTARDGKQQTRGSEGFLASATLDNVPLPRLTLGQSHMLSNGRLNLSFVGQEKTGPYDVDVYSLRLDNLLELDLKLRAAHPLLQTPEDAQVHINVMFVDSNPSGQVHGVMGQTFRSGRERRTMEYSRLSALLHHPVSVDGEEGRGFLDGEAADYETTGVTAADCKFTAFNGGQLPLLVE